MKRLKYLAAINPSLPRNQVPKMDDIVSFIPMERIGEDGSLDLSEVRAARDVCQGYTAMLDGDLVIAKITPCFENGKGALCQGLSGGVGYGTTELMVLRAKHQSDSRFLYWLTRGYHFRNCGEAEMRGSAGQKRVTEEFVSNYLSADLTPAEQRRIADYLDAATGKIDRLVALRRRQIELLKEQRAALIQQAVTRGLDPNVPIKDSGLPWLGRIPKHWMVKRNKFIFREIDSRSADGSEELLTVSHITGVTPRAEKEEVGMFLAESNEGYKRVEINDLAINTMWAWMGALGFSKYRGIVSPSYNVYRFRGLSSVAFYDLLFRSPQFIKEITRHSTGIWESRLRLYPHAFFEIRAPIPPLVEQVEIVNYVEKITGRTEDILTAYTRQIELLGEYRAALIHEAVTGQKAVLEEGVSAETGREANVHFRRSVLGAEIIHRLHDDAKFGRVKLEKLLYLSEAFAGMDLQGHYLRAAAGPFDNFALRSVESQIQCRGWYRSVKEDKRTRYVPLAKAGGHQTYFAEYWQEQKPKFEQLMELLRPATTQQCEIVATLFAAWNDRLAAGQKSDDDDLVDEVLKNWHPDKQKIERERWLIALGWMREHGLVPEGTRVITHGKSKGTGQRLVPEALAGRARNDP